MDDHTSPGEFVTVFSFYQPWQLAVFKARLESEGIEYQVQDEFTIQLQHFYSNAVGGIKLQVHEEDLERTREILRETGYLSTETPGAPWNFLVTFDNKTKGIPFFRRLPVELRLVLLPGTLLVLAWLIIFIATLPGAAEKLTRNSWCMEKVTYKGKDFSARTYSNPDYPVYFEGQCEFLRFNTAGTVRLPGFFSREIYGRWLLNDGKLVITDADTFGFVYNGKYEIYHSGGSLVLESDSTILYAHAGYSF